MAKWNKEEFTRVPSRSALQHAMDNAVKEEDIQNFLSRNRGLLAESLGLSKIKPTTLVLPKFPLGCEYVPDFIAFFWDSSLFRVNLIELEPINDQVVSKAGTPSARLSSAMKQVADWKQWLEKGGGSLVGRLRDNIWEHAPEQLADFFARHWVYADTQYEFSILIGRSSQWDPPKDKQVNAIRNMYKNSVRIYSYDRLIRYVE